MVKSDIPRAHRHHGMGSFVEYNTRLALGATHGGARLGECMAEYFRFYLDNRKSEKLELYTIRFSLKMRFEWGIKHYVQNFKNIFKKILKTLSPAKTRNDSITCSAVSLSVVSRVMNSINERKVTWPVPVGSTIARIRWNSASPYYQRFSLFRTQLFFSGR